MGIFDSFNKKSFVNNEEHIENVLSEFELIKISGEKPTRLQTNQQLKIFILTAK